MASRRLRLKGIANIPSRKKPDNEITNNQNESVETEKPNLKIKETTPDVVVENEVKLNEASKSPEKIEETVPVVEEEIKPQKPPPLIRRKFIKPSIAIQSINRSKAVEDREQTHTNQENNEKIVILNETVIEPNFIQLQSKDKEVPANELKVTENELKVTENELKVTENELKVTENELKVTENELKVTENNITKVNPVVITTNNEYPPPPPSPSKINRSRIKAIPRLHQRKTSFSASESEDETRKNTNRHRNDSICSTTSTTQSECILPPKPKEFNSVIQRKCRRTEQSRKLAEARRDFYLKFGNNKPDRQKLTMMDLIFYNPTTNLMSNGKKSKNNKKVTIQEDSNEQQETEEQNNSNAEEDVELEESVDDPSTTINEKSDEENELPAPQIKIGPTGEIIIDEQSLIIENKAVKRARELIRKSKLIDGDSETNYGIYKRAKRAKDWAKYETLRFYKALNIIGTDFTLMSELFPNRSRRELKMKFKKEERVNKNLVDRAVTDPAMFKFNEFKLEVEMEEKELAELEKQKKKETAKKKQRAANINKIKKEKQENGTIKPPKEKKPRMDIMDFLDDGSDEADESELNSDYDPGDEFDSNETIKTIQRPTRSGRVPKIIKKYDEFEVYSPCDVPVTPTPSEPIESVESPAESMVVANDTADKDIEPGSLMFVADSATDNNQSVYKVFMVSPDKNGYCDKQNVFNDAQSILTITESKLQTVENGVNENNLTIPAENVTLREEEEEEEVVAGVENQSGETAVLD